MERPKKNYGDGPFAFLKHKLVMKHALRSKNYQTGSSNLGSRLKEIAVEIQRTEMLDSNQMILGEEAKISKWNAMSRIRNCANKNRQKATKKEFQRDTLYTFLNHGDIEKKLDKIWERQQKLRYRNMSHSYKRPKIEFKSEEELAQDIISNSLNIEKQEEALNLQKKRMLRNDLARIISQSSYDDDRIEDGKISNELKKYSISRHLKFERKVKKEKAIFLGSQKVGINQVMKEKIVRELSDVLEGEFTVNNCLNNSEALLKNVETITPKPSFTPTVTTDSLYTLYSKRGPKGTKNQYKAALKRLLLHKRSSSSKKPIYLKKKFIGTPHSLSPRSKTLKKLSTFVESIPGPSSPSSKLILKRKRCRGRNFELLPESLLNHISCTTFKKQLTHLLSNSLASTSKTQLLINNFNLQNT